MANTEFTHADRLLLAIKHPEQVPWTPAMESRRQDTLELLTIIAEGTRRQKLIALAILGKLLGTPGWLLKELGLSRATISRKWKVFRELGTKAAFVMQLPGPKRFDETEIKTALFSVLHSPPAEHNINRTSWKLDDIRRCLLQQGIRTSKTRISRIVKDAGFRWRKAKTVLTSNDPEYRDKLNRIKSILSTLGGNDRFFSIDEFGPFAVKMKGGKRLVGATEYPHVPQFQKSKGCLIVTAALELSQNQVTHFYSTAKNTTEMIRLLEVLVEKYKGCRRLSFSWDAASWHASKRLNEKVDEINSAHQEDYSIPAVELVPLPASAQFLNVIESVFSGMAKAIIHNSDYQSVEEAVSAIDRYFFERNVHYREHPKRAGKKIWGDELMPCEFAESNNCKNPKWR